MKCKEFEQMIPDILEGRIKGGEMQELDQHLVACSSCSSLVAKINSVNKMIDNLPKDEPQPFFTARVMHRIESVQNEWYSLTPVLKGKSAVAVSSFVVVFGIFLGILFGGQLSVLSESDTMTSTEYLAQEYFLDEFSSNTFETYLMDND